MSAENLSILFIKAAEAINGRIRPILKSHGLTEAKWRILKALDDHGALNTSDLAENATVLAPSLSRALSAMIYVGLIKRRTASHDTRIKRIHLTKKGQRLYDKVKPKIYDQYDQIHLSSGPTTIHTLGNKLGIFIAKQSVRW